MKHFIAILLLSALSFSVEATIHTVQVGSPMNAFTPSNLTITLGDTVKFVWAMGTHTTTSDATIGPDTWNNPITSSDSVFHVVLTTVGTHTYHCVPHIGLGMTGTIVVQDVGTGLVENNDQYNFLITPNPTYGVLNISSNFPKDFTFLFSNLEGKELMKKELGLLNNSTLDLTELNNGVYLLNIFSETGVVYSENVVLNR